MKINLDIYSLPICFKTTGRLKSLKEYYSLSGKLFFKIKNGLS